ncbi:TetR/AcrR family transcriptional regulator [Streptomyces sp. NPDC048172]|uniref:TetR/AcrR family transcriptional regulator n=1 Tax=Streptomyces sp. NPDC048172 TaxID=3365505 RepID=UPI00371B328B
MTTASDRRTAILESAARVIARRGVRGLRVEELAAEAGVSTALIYYHFKDRAGVLRRTLEFINDRAERYTTGGEPGAEPQESPKPREPLEPLEPRQELERALLLELQDDELVRENSTAWGELRASAVFEPDLRHDLAKASLTWVQAVADLLGQVQPMAPAGTLALAAERLTALLEGLSMRWLSGILPLAHARALMREAIAVELERLEHP